MNIDLFRKPRRQRASALIAVYWCIAVLSAATFTTAYLLFSELEAAAAREQAVIAGALADMGIAIAAHPDVTPDDPVLRQQFNDSDSFEAIIESETARINLNALLSRDQRRPLEELFVLWGADIGTAVTIVDRLLDWVDADNVPEGQGAERNAYLAEGLEGLPYNRQFLSLEEVSLVPGFDLIQQLRPDWRVAFTLWGDGRLDLTDAEADVIAAICGCPLETATSFVHDRRGPDGAENTEDDVPITGTEEVLSRLGANSEAAALVTVSPTIIRIRSIGRSDFVRVEKSLILQSRGAASSILDFQMRRL